jgi:DNA-binding transcriptional regulator PaaX
MTLWRSVQVAGQAGCESHLLAHAVRPLRATWTVLSRPLPETLRNVRSHMHGRLAWAGFGAPQANLWVAPGQVDVQDLLGDLLTPEALSHTQAFHGTPTAPSRPDQPVRQAWDLDDNWPADRSARTFQRLLHRLGPAARQQPQHLVHAGQGRELASSHAQLRDHPDRYGPE